MLRNDFQNGGHPASLNDLEHLQNALILNTKLVIESQLPQGVTNCILRGCTVTKDGDDYTHTAGSIYYNGEAYEVDALSSPLTSAGGTPSWALVTTYGSDNPVSYASGDSVNVHAARKLQLVAHGNPAALVAIDALDILENYQYKPYSTHHILMAEADLSDYFDAGNNFIGLGPYKGWKLAKGTRAGLDAALDASGRVLVVRDERASGSQPAGNQDADYRTMLTQLGEKEHQLTVGELPAHKHGQKTNVNTSAGTSGVRGGDTVSNNLSDETEETGSDEPHENRQPSLVCELAIKLPVQTIVTV